MTINLNTVSTMKGRVFRASRRVKYGTIIFMSLFWMMSVYLILALLFLPVEARGSTSLNAALLIGIAPLLLIFTLETVSAWRYRLGIFSTSIHEKDLYSETALRTCDVERVEYRFYLPKFGKHKTRCGSIDFVSQVDTIAIAIDDFTVRQQRLILKLVRRLFPKDIQHGWEEFFEEWKTHEAYMRKLSRTRAVATLIGSILLTALVVMINNPLIILCFLTVPLAMMSAYVLWKERRRT